MAPVLDGTNHQTIIGGKVVQVSDLTREQAISLLCEAYDVIEGIDSALPEIEHLIGEWRNGT